MVFFADLPVFHCAGPRRICIEEQGSTKAFGVSDAVESSGKMIPDGSSQLGRAGWLVPCATCSLFPQDGSGLLAGLAWGFISRSGPGPVEGALSMHVPQAPARQR